MTSELPPPTHARLDAIDAREKAASAGPWWTTPQDPAHVYAGRGTGADLAVADDLKPQDAAFIAHARQDIPYLLTIARQAQQDHALIDEGDWGPDLCGCGEYWPCDMRKLLDAHTEPGES